MSHERIEQEARVIASMLDRGDAHSATERLREDLRNCSAQEFHAIVNRTYRLEDPNRGANLVKETLYYGNQSYGNGWRNDQGTWQNDYGSRQNSQNFVLKVVGGRDNYYDDWERGRWDRQGQDRFFDDRRGRREYTIAEMGVGVRASQGPLLREQLPGHIIADLMDRGDTRTAAAALRTEAQYGNANRFDRLLDNILAYERQGIGADLSFRRQQQYTWRNDGTDRIQVELRLNGRDQWYGRDQYGRDQYGRDQYGRDQYGRNQYGRDQYGRDQYGRDRYNDRIQVAEITYYAQPRRTQYDDRYPYDDRRRPW